MTAREALRKHWPEYLMEAAALGLFMVAACVFDALIEHPMSPLRQTIGEPFLRRALMGAAMGATAVALITSPWGKRSGAHMNPSVTLAFTALGKVAPWDAFFYISAQFAGGIGGVQLADLAVGTPLRHAAVNYAVTAPGPAGDAVAFGAEIGISAVLMAVVLSTSRSRRLSHWTPAFAGLLVSLYILVESPLSGMSMNPARTFGSAFGAGQWTALWIYFTAPLLGMVGAALFFRFHRRLPAGLCARLHRDNHYRCIFLCCNTGAKDSL